MSRAKSPWAEPVMLMRTTIRCMLVAIALTSALAVAGEALGADSKHQAFPSPDEAVTTLVDATKTGDMLTLSIILGREGRDLLSSGDAVADRQARERFVASYEQSHKLDRPSGTKAILLIGSDNWPFPIPLVKVGEVWSFDTAAGKEEILRRRIGRNELSAIRVCLAYVDAQREYARKDRDSNGLLEYARKFESAKGKQDGLFWETKEGEAPSPLGPLVAKARAAGYSGKGNSKPAPYNGYLYKILTAQGPAAPGGGYDYLVKGKMIGGFALIAYPVQYGVSGVMTFIVNHDGIVYQKNLGNKTPELAGAMKTYNPDPSWTKSD